MANRITCSSAGRRQRRRADNSLGALNRLHHIPADSLRGYGQYYGISIPCFLSHLGSFGLRLYNGNMSTILAGFCNKNLLRNFATNCFIYVFLG